MHLPHNIFAFESGLTLHIFVAIGSFDVLEFCEFADKASSKYIPDKVALYYPEWVIDNDVLGRIRKEIKARFHCAPVCYKFKRNGRFGRKELDVKTFLENGVNEIIRLREPLVLPPPGRCFVKPSGAKESYFIHAANLFVRHAEMSFYALLLIRQWDSLFDKSVKTIYVDTIDLYGLVSVACRMRFGTEEHRPITVSYSSYSSYKEVLKHADVSSSLMIISATTSHNLLEEIIKNTRWTSFERVVTILGLSPGRCQGNERNRNYKVISHVSPEGIQPHIKLLPSLRLSGEKFTIEADEPKSVVLNTVTHAKCLKSLRFQDLKDMTSCFEVYAKKGNDRLPIGINSVELFKNKIFLKWLRDGLEKYAPVSTSHVVFIGGIAEELKPLLEIFGGNRPTLISPEDIRDPKVKISGSIVVVCPTFTTGAKLLEVSRDLRKHEKHKNIVYFTGIGTPVSTSDFNKLKNNLEHGLYQVRSFCNLCTGQPESLNVSWKSEQELLRGELKTVAKLSDRRTALENGNLRGDDLFYCINELELHEGFKYWKNLIDSYPRDGRALLLFTTFLFLLQNARIGKDLPEKDKLTPLPNRRVLLDPENFFRYNDSLIQVVILRSAFPGELDFSDHKEHSASMFYLIKRSEQVKSKAMVYELLLALATRRLSITTDQLDKVRDLIRSSDMKECGWFRKIEFFARRES